MDEVDFEAVVKELVAEELGRRLARYSDLLNRFEQARRALPKRHRPGRPPRAQLERAAAALFRKAPAPRAAPASVEPGQTVQYRQGRGTFEARVVRLDGARVVLERLADGKRVTRPLSKLG